MTRTQISLLVAAVLALAAIGYALVPRGSEHLAGVVSIETTTTYRDPQLLAKA
jgi:hypothetical protein